MPKAQYDERIRNIWNAEKYLKGLIPANNTIEIFFSLTNDKDLQFFMVTYNGALIGKGSNLEDAVKEAEKRLTTRETSEPTLFSDAS